MFGAAIPFILILITLAVGAGEGLFQIFEGVGQEFIEFPQGAFIGALSGAKLAHSVGVFGISTFFCGLQMMENFTSCIFYYILEIIGKTLYFIPMLVFMMLDFVGGKGKIGSKIETNLWSLLEKLDRFTIDRFGFHIIHFPKSIRDKCYNCRRLKPSAFVRKTGEFVDDLTNDVIPLTTGGFVKMLGGFEKIINAFSII